MKTKFYSLFLFAFFGAAMQAQSISSVAPNNGVAGCQVTITGSGFSSTASENQVFFGKSKANVISVNSAGTELVVNTPSNPTFPSQISVLNGNSNSWITSDLRFRFTYGARINPSTRNIQQQYQSESVPSTNLVTNLGRKPFGFSKGPFLVSADFTDDGSTDVFLQSSNVSQFNSSGADDFGQHTFLENANPTFTYTANGNGFTSVLGTVRSDRLYDTETGIPYPEIQQTGVISADLNNDGIDEVIVYGGRRTQSYQSTLTYGVQPGFNILEFDNSNSGNLISSESLTNKNIFSVTSNGGIDYHGWIQNSQTQQQLGYVGYAETENTGEHILLQTSILRMKASDIDGDGDLDLVALLSWPLLRFEQGASNVRGDRPQIYIFENTTSQGSNVFSFNSSQYNDGTLHTPTYPSSSTTMSPPDDNFKGHLGNFLGPDHVISLNNSTFTGYNIDRWISDFELSDIDGDGDFDIVVKGIENLSASTNSHVDTTHTNTTSNAVFKMEWIYDGNLATGLKAASSANNGFLSWFENNSTSSGLSFNSETIIDGSVPNNGKFDWGGIDANDINNDGDLDIILSTPDNSSTFSGTPDVSVYLNTGSGSFASPIILDGPSTPSMTQSTQGYVTTNMMCEDLNGDGLLDIAVNGSNMGDLYTYMQLPGNSTISASSFSLQKFDYNNSMGEILDMSLADYSDDGKPDLAVVVRNLNLLSSSVKYFKNNNGEPTVLTSGQLGIFRKCLNNTSAAKEFTVGGINISNSNGHTVTATVSSEFEITLDSNSSYSSSVSVSPDTYNDIAATKVYIRAKATSNALSFQGSLTVSSQAAVSVVYDLNGSRRVPLGGTLSPSTQYVNTTNTPSPAPTSSPSAVSTPGVITLVDFVGDIQWQVSSDNSTWSDITGATTAGYTLPQTDIEGAGIVYLRAKLTSCLAEAFSPTAVIVENIGAPAPPELLASNGQTIQGTFDENLATSISLTETDGTPIATCSNLTSGCSGWTISNGTFEFSPSPSLTDGTEIIANASSNSTGSVLTSESSNIITVDAVQPNAPVLSNSNGASISGTAEAGSTVSITYLINGNSVAASVVADASGNFTYYPPVSIADGTTVTVTSTDEAGNVSPSGSVTVDANTPTLTPAVSNSNGVAITNTSEVNGTTEAGAEVVVTLSNGDTYTTIADQNGSYSVDISSGTFSDGDELYVVATDAAGNSSTIQITVIDAIAPSAPTVNATNGSQVTGTAEPYGTVDITYIDGNGNTVTETVSVASTGEYSFTPTSTIADGTVLTLVCKDQVGNASVNVTETVDGTSPVLDSDYENASGGAIASTSTISGTTEAGSTVTLTLSDGTELTQTTTSGSFSFDVSSYNLSDGDAATIESSDAAGNSTSLAYTIDATAPSVTVDGTNGYVGTTITGTTEAGATVTLSYVDANGTSQSTDVTADNTGSYTYTDVSNSIPNNATVTITSADAVGNVSTAVTVIMDNEGPSLTGGAYTSSSNQSYTNANVLTGTTDANQVVTISFDDNSTSPSTTVTQTVTADNSGAYTFDLSTYTVADEGTITVQAADALGNVTTLNVIIDDSNPTASIYASDGSTFQGTLDGEDYAVTISYGTPSVTQSANVSGTSFNWTPSSSLGLSPGDIITYTITDGVGNETTYQIPLQSDLYCVPAHTSGIYTNASGQQGLITGLTFKPSFSASSSEQSVYNATTGTFSIVYNDFTGIDTILINHDNSLSEIFLSIPNNSQNSIYYQIWVDLNQDGDFDDLGEEQLSSAQEITSSQQITQQGQLMAWSNPFGGKNDGEFYIVRIGISDSQTGVSDECGTTGANATFFDLKFRVLNCEAPESLSMSQNSTNSTQLDITFQSDDASMAVEYVIATGSYPFGNPNNPDVDTWISSTTNATVTTTTLSGTWNSSTSKYDYAYSATTDSEGNSLSFGSRYTVAVKNTTCASPNWVPSSRVELVDPNGPDFATSDFAITTPANTTYQQQHASGQFGPSPSNTLNLPVGQSLSVKTTVKTPDGSAVTPSVFYYIDLNTAFSQTATLAEKVLGTIDQTVASNLGQTTLSVTNNNEVTYTTTPTSATSYWLTYTFKDLAQSGTSASDAMNAIFSGSNNALSVAWYEAPVLNSAGDGLTGAVPVETVTLVLNGTTYTATAGNDGTVAVTSFTDGSNPLSSDAISSLVNGSYSIDQTWTSGGATYSNTSLVLSRLAINAAPNSVSGTAAPGATVTLTIGDETFTTMADATTGIYDFAGTTSSTTSPSTGVAFSTLVPFTATTAYTINQSMSGYTSSADVTGSILAATSDISVPSISGALALTNSCFTTIAGTGEPGSLLYLYDDQGNQLFDANGEPLTTTIEFPAPSSIFEEDWESGTSGWTIDNPDNSTTWQSTSVTGASSGTTAMYMNSYSYSDAMQGPFGARDALISPAIDFSNYSSVSMSFEYASAWLTMPWGLPEGDSLWVYVSDDNGTTWDKVAEYDAKDQSFTTGGDVPSSSFAPSSASDWCSGSSSVTCPTINLNTYAGLSGILVKFVYVSRNAQNFYLDNISITGQPLNVQGTYSTTVDLCNAQVSTGSNTFASAYTSPYTGEVIQVGTTDADGNTAPLSAAFVNPSVYTSSGTWTDASGNSISAPSTSGAATSSSPVIRYETDVTLGSGISGYSGLEVANGSTVTVPTDGCLDIAGSIAIQGTGSISLGAVMNSGGTDVESAQLKFTGEYLGPPTLEMNGQLFKSAHTIGSPMKEGFVSSDLGDETKLIGWDAYSAGDYYSAGEAIATQGLGFYAIVGSNQFISQAGGFDVIGSPMSSLDMSLGYVVDNYSTTSAGSGWNMIANPYTCGWDWGNSTLTNVSGTFYIYDVSSGSWTFWNSDAGTGTGLTSEVIPPLQGIWVQATSANATVSSTMSAAGELTCASGSSQNGFLKTANSIYKLTTTAVGDSSDYSEMYLVNIAGAKDGFDAAYDAWHMNGHLSRGKLYNLVGEEEMVSNALEIDTSKVLDLAFDSDNFGITYELNLLTSNADSTLKVVLEDRYEGTFWSMENGAYIFVHTQAPIGMKQTRFVLHYYQEGANVVGEDELDEEAGITVAGTTITVTNPEAYGEYQVYDASGRLITKGAVVETIMLPADNWEAGIYRLVFVGEQITTISIAISK